jgi:hypothetical protein
MGPSGWHDGAFDKRYSNKRRRVRKRMTAHHYYAIRAWKSSISSTAASQLDGYIKQTHAGLPVKKAMIGGEASGRALRRKRLWLASQH